jgi:hypothetical protein
MSQYKVILRDDSGVTPVYREDIVEFEGSKEELLTHSHIVEVLEEVKKHLTILNQRKNNVWH